MSDLTLTVGEGNYSVDFAIRDIDSGGPFDLSPYNDIILFIKTTDYLTDIVPGGILLGANTPLTAGVVTWDVDPSEIPSFAGQFYGKIDFTSNAGEVIKTNQFDIRVTRSLSS